MSWRPDSPEQLPDGRLVCGTHGLVVCPYCCVDYSFMDEVLAETDEDGDEDDSDMPDLDTSPASLMARSGVIKASLTGPTGLSSRDADISDLETPPGPQVVLGGVGLSKHRVGTGKVIPKKFTPPSEAPTCTPQLVFPRGIGINASPQVVRFIRRTDPTQILIYTDGACLDNGSANPRAGCAFVFRPAASGKLGYSAFRLENKGPSGEPHAQTSNRAELRAVIAALRFRYWRGEGFKSIVIATDSEYVVEGATGWVRGWLRNGWKTSAGAPVKNKDLWQCLLGEAERWSDSGITIEFWRIPRELNTEADQWAKHAAANKRPNEEFTDIKGVLV